MKNLSMDFKRALATNDRRYLVSANIIFPEDIHGDREILYLTNAEIWAGGFSYEELVSEDDEFTALGAVYMGTASLIINNMDEQYTPYVFEDAEFVILSVGMKFPDTSQQSGERLDSYRVGTYKVSDVSYDGARVSLKLQDNIAKLDKPYSTSTLAYPATLAQIVADICADCEITLAPSSSSFPHSSFTIDKRPDTEALTYRTVLSWVATIAGCFAKCNPYGQLDLKWFDQDVIEQELTILDGGTISPWNEDTTVDGGTISPWSTASKYDGGEGENTHTFHTITSLFSQTVALDDVVITGLSIRTGDSGTQNSSTTSDDMFSSDVTIDDNTFFSGTEGYVISVEDNKFITTSNIQTIGTWLSSQLIGLRFRKLSISIPNDPSIEAGDIMLVYDRKGRSYIGLVTRTNFSVSGTQELVSGANTPTRHSATQYSALTRSMVEARRLIQQERTAFDVALQNLSDRLNEKAGLYPTIETSQSGGNIYYLHDQPLLADSTTVIKITSSAIGITDHYEGASTTWNYGVTVDGTTITRLLQANGINANWINAGQVTADYISLNGITVQTQNPVSGEVKTTFQITSDGHVNILADSFSLTNGGTVQDIAQSTANAAINNLDISTKLNQDNVIAALKGSGTQAIYAINGQIYISATYLQGLKLSAIQADIEDLRAIVARIGGFDIGANTISTSKEIQNRDYKFEIISATNQSGQNSPILRVYHDYHGTEYDKLWIELDGLLTSQAVEFPQSGNPVIRQKLTIFGGALDAFYNYIGTYIDYNGITLYVTDLLNPKFRISLSGYDTLFWFTNDIRFNRAGNDVFVFSTTAYFYTDINMSGNDIVNQSDIRLKTNIKPIQNATEKLLPIEVVSFDWKENGKHVDAGVVAQNVIKSLPDLVVYDKKKDIYNVNYIGFIPYLIKAIQEKDSQISALEERISSLEARLERLESLIGGKL